MSNRRLLARICIWLSGHLNSEFFGRRPDGADRVCQRSLLIAVQSILDCAERSATLRQRLSSGSKAAGMGFGCSASSRRSNSPAAWETARRFSGSNATMAPSRSMASKVTCHAMRRYPAGVMWAICVTRKKDDPNSFRPAMDRSTVRPFTRRCPVRNPARFKPVAR
ncbi:MAG TPA: hypothetical protein VML19_13040 [Verrucomicrobiae bacterium]|nr:hypothetical protein [Verrucomicrobiae bacterium]